MDYIAKVSFFLRYISNFCYVVHLIYKSRIQVRPHGILKSSLIRTLSHPVIVELISIHLFFLVYKFCLGISRGRHGHGQIFLVKSEKKGDPNCGRQGCSSRQLSANQWTSTKRALQKAAKRNHINEHQNKNWQKYSRRSRQLL